MTVLKIARMGHPVLLERCRPVADPGASEIRRPVRGMFDTMEDAPGVGLVGSVTPRATDRFRRPRRGW